MENKETLEEFIKKYQKNKTYWNLNEKDDEARNIRIGAKWQQEQDKKMYSEEDLLSAFEAGMMFIGEDKGSFREWFEQLKNK
jgi:hypothetical protein